MTEFTKGPWKLHDDGFYPVIVKDFTGRDHNMLVCHHIHGYMNSEKYDGITEDRNQLANARLIAAAPDLYEALELAKDASQTAGGYFDNITRRKIDAALKKARGE
jgi:hypothetical protein